MIEWRDETTIILMNGNAVGRDGWTIVKFAMVIQGARERLGS